MSGVDRGQGPGAFDQVTPGVLALMVGVSISAVLIEERVPTDLGTQYLGGITCKPARIKFVTGTERAGGVLVPRMAPQT